MRLSAPPLAASIALAFSTLDYPLSRSHASLASLAHLARDRPDSNPIALASLVHTSTHVRAGHSGSRIVLAMSDSSPLSLAASTHVAASSSSASVFNSAPAEATTVNSTTLHMQHPSIAQQMHAAPLALVNTHSAPASSLPVNAIIASPAVIENEQPQVGASAASADSAKSPALLPINGRIGLLQSVHSDAPLSTSSGIGAATSGQLMKLVTGPALTTSDHQMDLSDNSTSLDHVTSQHLAISPPAVVAPTGAASSSRPISANPEPILLGQHPSSSSAPPLPPGAHLVDDAAPQQKMSALDASLAACWSRSKTGQPNLAPALDGSPSARPDCSFLHDTVCHCLVVDESRLSDQVRLGYNSALEHSTTSQRATLLNSVIHWLGVASDRTYDGAGRIGAARISHENQTRTLHINFDSHRELAFALERFPFLIRCGSNVNSHSRWNKPQQCGPVKHRLPELIKLTFTPMQAMESHKAEAAIKKLLDESGIAYTTIWMSLSHPAHDSVARRTGPPSHTGNFLPRIIHEHSLRDVIKKLHLFADIDGGKCRLHAPNTPSLVRCRQCDSLGHQATACEMYEGVAVRLLMKNPAAIVWAQKLAKAVDARAVYLGSDIHEGTPSRRVTLLFNKNEEQDIASRLEPYLAALKDMLHKAPHTVSATNRSAECRECGSLMKPHSCPFASTIEFRVGVTGGAGRVVGAVAAIGAAVSQADNMCRSWKSTKTCPRLSKNHTCKFDHPVSHVPAGCFDFARDGSCRRGAECQYSHTAPSGAPATPDAASLAAAHIPSKSSAPNPPRASGTKGAPCPAPQEEKEKHVEPALSVRSQSAAAVAASKSSAQKKRAVRSSTTPSATDDTRMTDVADAGDEQHASADEEQQPSKKKRGAAAASTSGIPHTTNPFATSPSWAQLDEEDEPESKEVDAPAAKKSTKATPNSSLGSLSSPSTSSAAPNTPLKAKKQGGGTTSASPASRR